MSPPSIEIVVSQHSITEPSKHQQRRYKSHLLYAIDGTIFIVLDSRIAQPILNCVDNVDVPAAVRKR